jgi:predicted hydrolase (HD superfamily)
MKREEALEQLHEWVRSPGLRRHSYAVEQVMRQAAGRYGTPADDAEQWALAGLMHDADYEQWPESHPQRVVSWLRERGETEVAYAVSAHGTTWGVPHLCPMDRALVACDELTGFITACALLRPDGVLTLEASRVLKKLKDPKFAAGVDRTEVYEGARILGVGMEEHVAFVIGALRAAAGELGLAGAAKNG